MAYGAYVALKDGIKHLVSDTAAFITSGGIILGAVIYFGDFPRQVAANTKDIVVLKEELPKIREDVIKVRESQIRTEETLKWLVNERRRSRF